MSGRQRAEENFNQVMPTIKKKVLFFDFVTHFGGGQRCTALLCKKLTSIYDVAVIDVYGSCKEYLEYLRNANVKVYILPTECKVQDIGYRNAPLRRIAEIIRQTPAFARLRKNLIQTIKQINPHLIWTNSSKALFFLGANWALRNYPVVYYAHGWYRKHQMSSIGRWLMLKRVNRVLAVSNPTAKSLQSWGVKEDKISVVYNTLDFDAIIESSKQKIVLPPPRCEAEFKILVPGTIIRTKGQYEVIQAAKIIKEMGRDFVIWLAGDGDADYINKCKNFVLEHSLSGNVFFLGWRKDVPALMRLADGVVLSTYTEGLPLTVQEAMILAKSVIATDVGGIRDLIIHKETGFLLPYECVGNNMADILAKYTIELMSSKDLAKRLGIAAKLRMETQFSAQHNIELITDAFEKTIASRKVL